MIDKYIKELISKLRDGSFPNEIQYTYDFIAKWNISSEYEFSNEIILKITDKSESHDSRSLRVILLNPKLDLIVSLDDKENYKQLLDFCVLLAREFRKLKGKIIISKQIHDYVIKWDYSTRIKKILSDKK